MNHPIMQRSSRGRFFLAFRAFLPALAIVTGIIVSGCSSPPTARRIDTGSPIRSEVSPKAKDLVLVNSLYLAPPIVKSRGSAPPLVLLYGSMKDSAQAELAIKLHFFDSNSSSGGLVRSMQEAFRAAEKIGADTVLITQITSYIEREGSAFGASQPAKVSFEMSAVRLSDSKPVWSASYSFSDTSFAEDVVKFGQQLESKGGEAGFTSAKNLFERGFRQGLRDLYEKRSAQFLTR